jgi:hypothetical protein
MQIVWWAIKGSKVYQRDSFLLAEAELVLLGAMLEHTLAKHGLVVILVLGVAVRVIEVGEVVTVDVQVVDIPDEMVGNGHPLLG